MSEINCWSNTAENEIASLNKGMFFLFFNFIEEYK